MLVFKHYYALSYVGSSLEGPLNSVKDIQILLATLYGYFCFSDTRGLTHSLVL